MKKLTAIFDSVILTELEEEEQYGNIYVSDLGKESTKKCIVFSVGPGRYFGSTFIQTQIKVGDIVLIPKQGPTVIKFNRDDYYTCPENMILAKIEDETNSI